MISFTFLCWPIKRPTRAVKEYAEIMQDTFGACPAELYTFFYPREDGETFVTSLYAEELASGRSGGVASLLEDLQDEDEVFRRFLQFYFPHFEEADSSVHSISRHIYESAYPTRSNSICSPSASTRPATSVCW